MAFSSCTCGFLDNIQCAKSADGTPFDECFPISCCLSAQCCSSLSHVRDGGMFIVHAIFCASLSVPPCQLTKKKSPLKRTKTLTLVWIEKMSLSLHRGRVHDVHCAQTAENTKMSVLQETRTLLGWPYTARHKSLFFLEKDVLVD